MAKVPTRQAGVPLSKRAHAGLPSTVDKTSRSFEIVIATETPVRTWVPNPKIVNPDIEDISYIEVDEVLVAAGMDFSRVNLMPLLDNHDTYSGLRTQIGRVDNVRIDGPTIVGTAVLSHKDAHLIDDIEDGFFRQVSAGYCHLQSELIERADDVPLLMVHRWQLHEASLVPVGADPNAFVRGQQRTFPRPETKVRALETKPEETKPMELEEIIVAAEEAVAALDEAVTAAGDDIDEALAERARAIRGARAEDDENADAPAAEETAEEKKDVEEVRSMARRYGKLTEINDMRKNGARAAELKKAMNGFIAAGVTVTATTDVKPASQRSAAPAIDYSKIYARANSVFKGRK